MKKLQILKGTDHSREVKNSCTTGLLDNSELCYSASNSSTLQLSSNRPICLFMLTQNYSPVHNPPCMESHCSWHSLSRVEGEQIKLNKKRRFLLLATVRYTNSQCFSHESRRFLLCSPVPEHMTWPVSWQTGALLLHIKGKVDFLLQNSTRDLILP